MEFHLEGWQRGKYDCPHDCYMATCEQSCGMGPYETIVPPAIRQHVSEQRRRQRTSEEEEETPEMEDVWRDVHRCTKGVRGKKADDQRTLMTNAA